MSDENPTTQFPVYGPPPNQPPTPPPPGQPPLPPQQPPGEPASPRRNRRLLLALLVTVAVLAGGGIGVAIGASGGDSTIASQPKGAPSSTTSGSPITGGAQNGKQGNANKGKKKGKQQATRGTIVAQSGSTWTLKTQAGKTITFTITPATEFGTKKAPASKADFTVGKPVAVIAKPGSNPLTAVRVRAPAAKGNSGKGGASSPAPSSSPS